MSIILKGIDISKDDEWLEIIIKPTKEVIVDTIRYRDNALLKTEYGSAIQIPEGHGRIGDLDKVKRKGIDDGYDFYVSWTDIDNEPTILEAEE